MSATTLFYMFDTSAIPTEDDCWDTIPSRNQQRSSAALEQAANPANEFLNDKDSAVHTQESSPVTEGTRDEGGIPFTPGWSGSPSSISPSQSCTNSYVSTSHNTLTPHELPKRSTKKSRSEDEGRKRARLSVRPEQRTFLEWVFSVNKNPPAPMIRVISQKVDASERQIRVWFQNRRAKGKAQEKEGATQPHSLVIPSDSRSIYSGYGLEQLGSLYENSPITIILCTELYIGSWRRMATDKHDLVAWICPQKHCLTWYAHFKERAFKMDISFDIVIGTDIVHAPFGMGQLSFTLSRPPLFYMQHDGSTSSWSWRRCTDWTESSQATDNLRHDLIGSSVQLSHIKSVITSMKRSTNLADIEPFDNTLRPSSDETCDNLTRMSLSSRMATLDRSVSNLLAPHYTTATPHHRQPKPLPPLHEQLDISCPLPPLINYDIAIPTEYAAGYRESISYPNVSAFQRHHGAHPPLDA